MQNVSFQAPTDYQIEASDIDRRRKYAEMLQQQAMEPIQAPPTPHNGFAVPISWTQGLAKALQGYTARKGLEAATAEQRALGDRYNTERAEAYAKAVRLNDGTPATSETIMDEQANGGEGQMAQINAPAVAGSKKAMIDALIGSKFPDLQAMGMQKSQKQMEMQDLISALNGGAAPAAPAAQATPVGTGSVLAPTEGSAPAPAQAAKSPLPAGMPPIGLLGAGDMGKTLFSTLSSWNKPPSRVGELEAAGIKPGTPEFTAAITDPSGRIQAQGAALTKYRVPGTSVELDLPQSVVTALNTGTAADDMTAAIATRVAQNYKIPVNIGVRTLGGLTGGAEQPAQLGEDVLKGRVAMQTGSVEGIKKDLDESLDKAQNAIKRHTTLQQIHSALASDKSIVGPAAEPRTWFQRVGETLFGPGNKKSLQETQQVVQGLSELALSAAGAMKGQGAITENERLLLVKARSGVQSLTVPELNTLLSIFDKQNRFEIQLHNQRRDRAEKIKYPNLDYWPAVDAPPPLGTAPRVGLNLSPAARDFMKNNNIQAPE